jgi:phosphoribosylamine--glycine ligase
VFTDAVAQKTMDGIVRPTIAAMKRRGTPYMGVLFAGLMIKDGEPKLIEYNCRFGDPECQVLMMRLKSDLLTALIAARDGQLGHLDLRWSDDAALTVVMATKGYPGDYAKGSEIRGLDKAEEHARVFHAGTARKDGKIVANGGRVLAVTASAPTIAQAQAQAYAAVDEIDWPEGFCRRDIGWRALSR